MSSDATVQPIPPPLVDELRSLLGERRVATALPDRWAYARDTFPLAIKEAARAGGAYLPGVVAWPETTAEVAAAVALAVRHRVPVVPYGGGSGIVGGALGPAGSMVLDLKRMNRIRDLDAVSLTVTVEAGALGKPLEDVLEARGYTIGHYPQSLYSSTVGGWIAHRGIGTFSTKYGKMDDMVVSLEVVLPDGTVLQTRSVPQSAAGPDLNRLFLGAEGTLGIVTAATLQIHPLAGVRTHLSYAMDSFDQGVECIRRIVHAELRPAVVRLYDAVETQAQFGSLGLPDGQAVVLFVLEGGRELVELTERGVRAAAAAVGARDLGQVVGEYWLSHRFSTAALCRTIARPGGVADALEVANVWSRLAPTYHRMKAAMEAVCGEQGQVYGHASHFYHTGGNLYMIFHAHAPTEDAAGDLYNRVLDAAFTACLAEGGTLTHHHGVGLGKARWMARELGETGLSLLRRIKQAADPAGIMNPGKLGL